MDIRHLRYVLAVAEERSFTRAAERLFISQPGLSRAIREFETEIGFPVFDRSGRQVELTPAGDQAIVRVRTAVAAFDAAVHDIHALSGRLRGPLRLGISIDAWVFVAGALGRLRAQHPDLALELVPGADAPLAVAMDRREIDAAIVWWPELDCPHETRHLLDVPSLLAVTAGSAADHSLTEVHPADGPGAVADVLHGQEMKLFDRRLGPRTYDALVENLGRLADLPTTPVPSTEGWVESSQAAMLQAAANDHSVTICTPAHFRRVGDPRLAAHGGFLADAQITMVHTPRGAALAHALGTDLDAAGALEAG